MCGDIKRYRSDLEDSIGAKMASGKSSGKLYKDIGIKLATEMYL